MKKKIAMTILAASMVGVILTGCAGKTDDVVTSGPQIEDVGETTDTETDVDTNVDVDEPENIETTTENDAEDVVNEENDSNTTESTDKVDIDETTILDSEIPDDPDEGIKILLSIEDPDTKYMYMVKADQHYIMESSEEVGQKWMENLRPYFDEIESAAEN